MNSPPVRAASSAPAATGRMPSSSPWMTITGQLTRSAIARVVCSSSPSPSAVAIRVSGSVSSPQPTASSICLVECGSLKAVSKKNWRKDG